MLENVNEEKKQKPISYRVITSIIFFTSLSMCVYQIYELTLLYLSDPIETQMKMIMHESIKFPAVTICNLNPVRRSRWQQKRNKTDIPDASPWSQKPAKLNRLARSLSFKRGHGNKIKSKMNSENRYLISSRVELKRTKRQNFLFNTARINAEIDAINQRLNEIEVIINTHINETNNNTVFNFTLCDDVLALSNKLNETQEKQVKLEEKVVNLETRLEVTEMTTADIVEEMERTRNYLKHLKANMSSTIEETTTNDTVVNTTDDGKEQLPPSKDLKAFQNYLKDIGEITREDFRELGNQKEDFIASCTWQGTICDLSHFEVFQNFMYGNCFTFNTSKVSSHVSGTGPYNGLSLSLFIEQDEYMDRIAPAAGARVVVHDFHFKPLPDEEGFSVAPGYTTAISLQKQTTETVKPICDPNIETSVQNGEKYLYSQKSCLQKCLSDEIILRCHCAGTQFLLDKRTCSLDNETEAECVKSLESLARANKLPCYCPLPCRTTVYNPIISSAVWPSEKYLPSLLEELVRVRHKVLHLFENITDFSQYFRRNFLKINIFFQDLKEQETLERRSYGIARLLSDIGGQLGLWVGVSVLTLVDFTENVSMLVMMLYRRIRNKLVRKSRRLSTPGVQVQPSLDACCAVDIKGSGLLTPQSSILHRNHGLVTTVSGISTKIPHVHFEEP